jgi:adenylosuccinate lyase
VTPEHDAWLVDLDGTLYASSPVKLAMLAELSLLGWGVLGTLRRFRAEHEQLRRTQAEPLPSPYRLQLERTASALGLAPAIGRQQAHDIVYDACRKVNEQGGTLADALAALPTVTQHFDRAAIARLTDPANYLGLAPQMVDRALALSAGASF